MIIKNVLIGGGSGFIGQRLKKILKLGGYNVTVLSRKSGINQITWKELQINGLPKNTNYIVNVTGQNVLEPTNRWTQKFKEDVWNSRINSTTELVNAIKNSESKPEVFVNISGVSLYKPTEKIYSEDDKGEDFDFMSKLCIEWEKASTIPKDICCKEVKIRTGAVIGREGGMIKSLMVPFFFGLGGIIGSGKQSLPWIHITDLCNLVKYSIENPKVSGILNGVAPEIITNEQFTKAFALALKRPSIFPLPEFIVNIIFGKERSVLLLKGAKIQPKQTLETGFTYLYPTIESACKEVTQKQ